MAADERPTDLIRLIDAASVVGRGHSTLRGWVADGQLRAWKGDGSEANAPTLVSKAELLTLAATSKRPAPGRRPGPAPAAAAPVVASAEVARLTADLREALARVDELRARLDERAEVVRRADREAADLRVVVDELRARVGGLEAEIAALRGAAGLPWWRRLLGAPPSLPG